METVTKADMVKYLVSEGLNRAGAREFVDLVFNEIKSAAALGKDVKLTDFGHFIPKNKKRRPGRNPKTQKSVPISARRVLTFRTGPKLKKHISGRGAAW